MEGHIEMCFAASGYMFVGFPASLEGHAREGSLIFQESRFCKRLRCVFGRAQYVCDQALRNSFVLDSGQNNLTNVLCVAGVLLLLGVLESIVNLSLLNSFRLWTLWSLLTKKIKL